MHIFDRKSDLIKQAWADERMAAYANAHLKRVDFGSERAEYIARVDDTRVPFGGRLLVHGARPIPMDGNG